MLMNRKTLNTETRFCIAIVDNFDESLILNILHTYIGTHYTVTLAI